MGTRRIKRRGRGRTRLDPNVHPQNPPAVRVNRDLAAEALQAQQLRRLRKTQAKNVLRKAARLYLAKNSEESDEDPETPRKLSTAAPSEPEDAPPRELTAVEKLAARKTDVSSRTPNKPTAPYIWYGRPVPTGGKFSRKTSRRRR